MPKIKTIRAYEVLASGGLPTVECKVEIDSGLSAQASVPYGASVGSYEAAVIVDSDPSRYGGSGTLKVCENIEKLIAPKLIGLEVDPIVVDKVLIGLDGTEYKTKLGGNAILAVSMAVCKVAAKAEGLEVYEFLRQAFKLSPMSVLPKPMVVAIEGGLHADNSTDFQEYLLSVTFSESAKENVRVASEVYGQVKKLLKKEGYSVNVGNEGAFAPEGIKSNTLPFELLQQAIEQAGFKPGKHVWLSLDAAASEVYKNQVYNLKAEAKALTSSELLGWYEKVLSLFPIYSLEDIFHEDAWDDWAKALQRLGAKAKLIGDDLTATNLKRLNVAIEKQSMSGILLKLNQAGSVSESIAVAKRAREAGYVVVPSHRGGGETNDTFMVDLAVALNAEFIKVGITRGERVAKYNRLMEIERTKLGA